MVWNKNHSLEWEIRNFARLPEFKPLWQNPTKCNIVKAVSTFKQAKAWSLPQKNINEDKANWRKEKITQAREIWETIS